MKGAMPFPVVIAREGRWFVASCPPLDIATQGRTENEAKSNIAELISDYMNDPDTKKPALRKLLSFSVSIATVPVNILEGVQHRKSPAVA